MTAHSRATRAIREMGGGEIASDEDLARAVIDALQDAGCRIFTPEPASTVGNGKRYFTFEEHLVEGYSALEHFPGYKSAGTPMLGPDRTVYVELQDGES